MWEGYLRFISISLYGSFLEPDLSGRCSVVWENIIKLFCLFMKVFTEYFKELEEESIRDNFVIIYELLDELMDFGYPQTTDSKILQEFITQVREREYLTPGCCTCKIVLLNVGERPDTH